MKKRILTLMMLGCAMFASAQQLANGTFDSDWESCYPWEKGNKVTKAYGTQPIGWCMSNVPNSLAGTVGKQVDGYNGGKAAQIVNVSAVGNGIPGYMTLGTSWATAETKGLSQRNKDGGVFGGISFSHRPDALSFVYQCISKKDTDNSTVVAYLWKGTWEQAEVPSNTAVGVVSWGAAEKVTMVDRDNNILGLPTTLGGTVTKTDDAELIASLNTTINTASEWTSMEIPFEYKTFTAVPQKLNIVFAAAGYLDGGGTITDGTSLTVDDVKLVYWNTLSSLKYDGSELLNDDATSYSVDAEYDAAKLVAVAKSQFAEVSTSYDENSAIATVSVKRENAANKHVYTIHFKKPVMEIEVPMTIGAYYGTFCAPFDADLPVFDMGFAYTVDGLDDDGATLRMTELKTSIPAHTPVVVYCNFYEKWDGTRKGFPTEGTPKAGLLTGTYKDIKAPKGSYVLQKQGEKVGFYKVEDVQPTVKAYHAYLNVPDSNVKAFGFSMENGETAIKALEALTSGKPEIYDLNGRKLNKLQKGMNIVNGMKVLVK